MNEVQKFRQVQRLRAERDAWQQRAIAAIGTAAALAFLLLCIGIGQFFYGG